VPPLPTNNGFHETLALLHDQKNSKQTSFLQQKDLVEEVKITPNHDFKDENCVDGIEFDPEEEDLVPLAKTYYDKVKSSFDNISCEIKERLEQQGPSGPELSIAEQRQKQSEKRWLCLETFEQFLIDGGRYCGSYRSCKS
ncbi:10213_t:CDS:2, partial [Scutellospora calospora]